MTAYRRYGPADGMSLVYLRDPWDAIDEWDPSIIEGLAYARPVILADRPTFVDCNCEIREAATQKAEKAIEIISDLSGGRVDLLGFSLGNVVAQCVLSTWPDPIRRVVFASAITLAGGDVDDSAQIDTSDEATPDSGTVADGLLAGFFAPTETSQAAGHDFLRRLRACFRDWERLKKALHLVQSFAPVGGGRWGGHHCTALLKSTHDSLIISGADDMIAPIARLFSLIGDLRLIIYPDAGHGAQFLYPHLFITPVDHFLSSGANA
jgi:pimeloyl-ACP methyl ester carboxylesterase